jgi:hypothetical protein
MTKGLKLKTVLQITYTILKCTLTGDDSHRKVLSVLLSLKCTGHEDPPPHTVPVARKVGGLSGQFFFHADICA